MSKTSISFGDDYGKPVSVITCGNAVVHDWRADDDDDYITKYVSLSFAVTGHDGEGQRFRVAVSPEFAEQLAGDLIVQAREARAEHARLAEIERKAAVARLLGAAS